MDDLSNRDLSQVPDEKLTPAERQDSNRDLSQVPDEKLTPAERQELKRRLDAFVAVVRDKVFRRRGPHREKPKAVTKWDPLHHGGKG
jgi:hypothetical protein